MAYTTAMVERLLRNYLNIISLLDARSQQLPTLYLETKSKTANIFSVPHARAPIDGKARARAIEELHVSKIDIEQALPLLHEDDRELLEKYYIYGTHTLDELAKEKGLSSRGSMQRRVYRSAQRLTALLEQRH